MTSLQWFGELKILTSVSAAFACSSNDCKLRLVSFPIAADDERIMRRESYLKATEGGRMNFDIDLSDGDISPQVLRR